MARDSDSRRRHDKRETPKPCVGDRRERAGRERSQEPGNLPERLQHPELSRTTMMHVTEEVLEEAVVDGETE